MHPKFEEISRKLEKHFKLGLVTTLYKYYDLLEELPTWVKISLDTVDPGRYQRIKGIHPKVLENVMKNMAKLYERKRDSVTLGTQMVMTEDNSKLEEIEAVWDRDWETFG